MKGTSNAIASNRLAVNGWSTTITTIATVSTTSIAMLVIKREASTAGAPANLPGESSAAQLHIVAAAKGERVGPVEGDMVVAPIPDARIHHAVGAESHDGTDNRASEDVIPVVELVNGQGASNQARAEHGGVDGGELPERGVVVGEDLELGVEVEGQEDESRKGSGGVTRRHRLERIINLIRITSADILGVVNLGETLRRVALFGNLGVGSASNVGLADGQEVRAQATDKPLDEDLEDGGGDEAVQKTQDAVVDVPKRADANLHAQDDEDGNDGGQEGGEPDGNDFLAHRVGELGVDNFAVGELDGKRAGGGRVGVVDLYCGIMLGFE